MSDHELDLRDSLECLTNGSGRFGSAMLYLIRWHHI